MNPGPGENFSLKLTTQDLPDGYSENYIFVRQLEIVVSLRLCRETELMLAGATRGIVGEEMREERSDVRSNGFHVRRWSELKYKLVCCF